MKKHTLYIMSLAILLLSHFTQMLTAYKKGTLMIKLSTKGKIEEAGLYINNKFIQNIYRNKFSKIHLQPGKYQLKAIANKEGLVYIGRKRDIYVSGRSTRFIFTLSVKPSYIFGNNVNIRQAPHTRSKVIATLHAGHKVIILKKTKRKGFYFGRISYWCRIQFNGKQGYVWGGLLAGNILKLKINRKSKYKTLLSRDFRRWGSPPQKPDEKKAEFGTEIRIYQKGKLVTKIKEGTTRGDQCSFRGFEEVRKKGFPPFLTIVKANSSFTRFATICVDGISYFFFHGNRFVQRLDLIKEAPGDRIRSSSKFIMPWDKGGKANSILVFDKVTETVMDSKGQRKSRSHRMMWSYYWDGRRFRESKKVPLKK